MERKDRPLGREKHVVDGSAHVGRRGTENSSNSTRQNNRSSGSPLLKLLALIVVLLFGGGGAMSGLFGSSADHPNSPSTSQTAPPSQYSTSASADGLDTSVSPQARAKRTSLVGDGSDTTTILLYMCGTDLESNGGFATKDLREMVAAAPSDQINLVVFTGGCKQWRSNQVSNSKSQIWHIKGGKMELHAELESLFPMTDPQTLAWFLYWGKQNFPANRYALIFWDHGGGSVSGYGYDEAYPQNGSMTLDEIASALKNGGVTFDFIGFDACLMATLETALVVEPYADYLIASEETEPGCGWYYTNWLSALSENPSMPALEIGKEIADSFVQVCGQAAPRQQATLSVIDLAELSGTVPDAFNRFAQATSQAIQSDGYQQVAAARGQTKEFAESSNIDQVDLIHLADNLNTAESNTLSQVLEGAVKYNRTSSNIQNANGISIYFPYGRTSTVNKASQIYNAIGLDASYTDCIKRFASLEVAGQSISGGSTGQMNSLFGALLGSGSGSASLDSAAVAQVLAGLLQNSGRSLADVNLSEEDAAFLDTNLLKDSVDYLTAHQFDDTALVWTEKDGQQVLALSEEQWNLVQDAELNVFVDDGSGYIDLGLDNVFDFNDGGDLIGAYDHTWLSVNGQIVAYYLLSDEGSPEDYKILGRIPAMLNNQRVDLIACFTDENPNGEILGASLCYDAEEQTETIARGLLDIQDGDTIDFLCDYYDYDRSYQDAYYLGDPLTVEGDLTLGNIQMDNTNYIAAYRITDIYHNHYWTPAIP